MQTELRNTATIKPIALAVALAFGAPAYSQQQTEQQLPEVKGRAVEDKPAEIGYQPKRATTATKTDANLMDVPQAVKTSCRHRSFRINRCARSTMHRGT